MRGNENKLSTSLCIIVIILKLSPTHLLRPVPACIQQADAKSIDLYDPFPTSSIYSIALGFISIPTVWSIVAMFHSTRAYLNDHVAGEAYTTKA